MPGLPELIEARKKELGQSDDAAARAIGGVRATTVTRWRAGRIPRDANVAGLANWLGMSEKELRDVLGLHPDADLLSQVAQLAQEVPALRSELQQLRNEVRELRREAGGSASAGRQRRR